jgi:hypothetical protein
MTPPDASQRRYYLARSVIDAATQLANWWTMHDQPPGWKDEFHRRLATMTMNVAALREVDLEPADLERKYTLQQICDAWGLSRSTIYRLCAEHGIKPLTLGPGIGHSARLSASDVAKLEAAWTDAGMVKAAGKRAKGRPE